MKNKLLILSILMLVISINVFAGETEDFEFLNNLYKNKSFESAIIKSNEFLNRYPNSKSKNSILDKLGKLYFLKKDYKNSVNTFTNLLKNNPSSKEIDEAYHYLAISFAGLNKVEESNSYLLELQSDKKLYTKTYFQVATTYMENEFFNEAIKSFKNLVDYREEYYEESLFNLGLSYFNNEQYSEAKETLDRYKLLNTKKNNIIINYIYGDISYKQNKTDEAIVYFSNVVSTGSNNIYVNKSILSLIEIYSNREDVNQVQFYLKKLIGKPEYNEAIRMIGDLYVTKKEYDKAISYYKQVTNIDDYKTIYGYGYALYKMDKLEESLTYFERLKDTPYYNQAVYHIFVIDYMLKNYEKIIRNKDLMKRVVVSQTDTDNINVIIANSAYELGNYELAKDYYGRLYAITPKKENLFRIVLMYIALNDLENAKMRFNEYRRHFSDDEDHKKDIYLGMGSILQRENQDEEALFVYKEYLEDSTDIDIISNLIGVLLKKQKYEEINNYLSELSESDRNDYLRGVANLGMGNYDKAEEYFQNAMKITRENFDKETNKVQADNLEDKKTLEKSKERYYEEIRRISLNRLRNFVLQENYDRAIKLAKEYIEIYGEKDRDMGEVLDKIALSYFRQNNFSESRKFYQKLSEIDGYSDYSNFQIADIFYTEKNYSEAISSFKYVYNTFPTSDYAEKAHYWVINIYAITKNKENFFKEKENFFRKYPDSNMKNSILSLESNIDEAISSPDTIEKPKEATKDKMDNSSKKPSEKTDTKTNPTKNELATIKEKINTAKNYEAKGDIKGAIKIYKELHSKKNKEIHKYVLEKLIYLNLKLKNNSEAKKYYNELNKLDSKTATKYKSYF